MSEISKKAEDGPIPLSLFAHRRRPVEAMVKAFLAICAAASILITVGIVIILVNQSLLFFKQVSLAEFFGDTVWQPLTGKFGVWPLINATMMTSVIAMLVALPLGLFVAIYLSEYAPSKVRSILKPVLEVLAGIPTVVYGFFALSFMTPLLRVFFGDNHVELFNMASAGLVMGVLITPLIASMTEDALSSVPQSLRQASFGLGANRIETSLQVVVPAAFSGIAAAFILGLSRAIGETMIVALASGSGSKMTFNPLEGAQTVTGYIVAVSSGDVAYNSPEYNSIFGLALVLFVITLLLNWLSNTIVARFQEVYE